MSATASQERRTCRCDDDADVVELQRLIAAGVPQLEASRAVWGPPAPADAPTFGDSPATWSSWIRAEVRCTGNAARRQLGLRELHRLTTGVSAR